MTGSARQSLATRPSQSPCRRAVSHGERGAGRRGVPRRESSHAAGLERGAAPIGNADQTTRLAHCRQRRLGCQASGAPIADFVSRCSLYPRPCRMGQAISRREGGVVGKPSIQPLPLILISIPRQCVDGDGFGQIAKLQLPGRRGAAFGPGRQSAACPSDESSRRGPDGIPARADERAALGRHI